MHIFYALMAVSLLLISLYKLQYSNINDSLEKDAYHREYINLLYLQSNIKKENSVLTSIYSNNTNSNFDKAAIQSIINSLYDYSGNSSIAASERTIYVGSLSISNAQKTQIANKNWVLSTSSQT